MSEQNEDKVNVNNAIPSLLLIGNSPNLVDSYNAKTEWVRLLDKLMEDVPDDVEEIRHLPSFPQRMQAIINLYRIYSRMGGRNDIKKTLEKNLLKWINSVGKLLPTAVHRMLVDVGFDYYLTTNYDLALDRVIARKENISVKFKKIEAKSKQFLDFLEHNNQTYTTTLDKISDKQEKVYHIHGVIQDPSSIVMTPQSYQNAVEKLKAEDKNVDWLKSFCESDVHICGLNLRPEEAVVWYALERKFKHIQSPEIKGSIPRTFVYLFYTEENEADRNDKKALEAYLHTLAVKTVLIPVRNKDYVTAWKQLIGELILNKNNYKTYDGVFREGETDMREDEWIEALSSIENGGGRIAARGSNMSTAFVWHSQFPFHCQFTLSEAKRRLIRESGRWMSYCNINGERYMYQFPYMTPIPDLIEEGNHRITFLLDYQTGELFRVTEDKTLVRLGFGKRIFDIFRFVDKKYQKQK